MKAVRRHLWAVWLLAASVAAQNPGSATVQNVAVTREGTDIRVEITLSAPVTPSVDTAQNPNRILLDFNYAYNPSCAYNYRWVCPLAPVENRLDVAIRAGEMNYKQ